MRRLSRFQLGLALALALIVVTTLLAYGAALHLPFFFDDLQHLVWLRNQTPGSIFVSEAGRPYYRPMQFLAWKLYETVFGHDSAPLYHGLNVFLHVLNAFLVVVLARRFFDPNKRGGPPILAGLIFVVFPYAYQVVPLPASLTHPLATLFVLLALLTYDRFQTTGRYRWLGGALMCALLAFTSNEGSFLLAGLIVLIVWIRAPRDRRWVWIGAFILLAAGYYVWYHSQQADNSGTLAVRNLEPIVQNAIYVLQGLTFPLQPVGQFLMDRGLSDQAAALSVGLVTLVGLAVLLWNTRLFRRFLFGVAWYGLCLAPAVVLLSHNYLINSPRLMYLGSVGAALLWASGIEAVWGAQRWRQGIAAVLAVALLIPAFVFVRQRVDMYTLMSEPLHAIITVADQALPTDRLLLVNLPAWAGPARNWYPIGHEGILLFYNDISIDDFLQANLGRTLPATAIEFDNISEPQPYYYGIYGPSVDWDALSAQVRQANHVYLTRYSTERVDLLEAGHLNTSIQATPASLAQFGDSMTLEHATWTVCHRQLNVSLDWLAAEGGDWHVFVHVLNPDGSLAAQHDSPPLLGLLPFWQWQPGDRVNDVHPIDLDQLPRVTARDQQYTIVVGLYDSGSGERLIVTQADGTQPADRAARIGTFSPSDDQCR